MNWRGRSLTSHDVIVQSIAATTTRTGLSVHAELGTDTTAHETGLYTGRRPGFTLVNRLLATLLHQRLGFPQVVIAPLFGVQLGQWLSRQLLSLFGRGRAGGSSGTPRRVPCGPYAAGPCGWAAVSRTTRSAPLAAALSVKSSRAPAGSAVATVLSLLIGPA